ncbi:hypothetical protein CPB85DRAFT_1311531 [Mucidula mucida]|nr:hypothetical protein CPB85DRAFT_1311531 [Mucidula mucida]
MSEIRTPKLCSGIYRIINEASQSTVRVHQHGRPMQLSYGFELLGIFEQWELVEQDKGEFIIRCMGLTRGQVGLDEGTMLINGGNPIPFSVEAVGEGLYAVKASGGESDYWGVSQTPTRETPEVSLNLVAPPSMGEFEATQLWRFERLDDDV